MNDIIVLDSKNHPTENISEELISKWIRYLDCSTKTIQTYTRNIRPFTKFLAENGINRPLREHIISYRDELLTIHKPTTVQAYLMAVKQFFRWLDQENIYPNIAKNIKGVRLDNSSFKKDYLTTSQVKTMLNSIDRTTLKGKRDYAILLLMVTTGLRTIEVARADLEDLRTVGNFTALFIQGKGKTDRAEFVKVVPAVEQALRGYLACRGMNNARDTDPLFSSIANRNDGERMTTRSISRICKEHMIDANLISSRLTAHSLRHTSATLNLLNGGSLEETRQLLRHSNISTTMIYAHSLERAKNDSENRIAQAIL